ncbi:MAG: hypothetical protein K2X87_22325 [Gemmataceae bacterium]|nr:hypothetical protein [Gemmataceae bacterium]
MPDESLNGEFDLGAALGAEKDFAVQCFTVYVPNQDRDGVEIGTQRKWVLEAIRLLTELNGGATAMPPAEGAWRSGEGRVVWEHPVVVYSYIDPEPFHAALSRVREFLHRMGRETNQGEVAFEFCDKFYLIRKYDPPASSSAGGQA